MPDATRTDNPRSFDAGSGKSDRPFRAEHERGFPKMAAPPISTGLTIVGLRYVLDRLGAGYLPLSVAASHMC
jgi:hypothetical protein